MMPCSPCDLCQNATPHRALWSEIRKRLGHISCTSNYSCSRGNGTSVHSRAINCHNRIGGYKRRSPMSVAKIIELSAESPKSFEDAIQNGISRASKTIHGIKSAWVKEQHVVIENGKVSLYRIDLKVTFVLD